MKYNDFNKRTQYVYKFICVRHNIYNILFIHLINFLYHDKLNLLVN
jgi:hypothetical protein